MDEGGAALAWGPPDCCVDGMEGARSKAMVCGLNNGEAVIQEFRSRVLPTR